MKSTEVDESVSTTTTTVLFQRRSIQQNGKSTQNLGLCYGMSLVPAGSNPAGQGLHLGTCMAQGRILFGLNPQE